ncbi:PIN domain-containing protein [Bradyrhizobium sp. LA7.1]|uniref:type II toxin-antitoxin system VapC family toxin n=1 Tax=Bradyrhizobium sp. LA7.1 TaxID=3156324 RepID=UPI003391C909
MLQSIDQYLTTDLVLVETCQLLRARFGRGVAEVFWERLRDSGVRIEPIVRADLDAASEIGARFPDESFSFVDRTSFALMERMGITRAATFNPGFAAYRPRRGLSAPTSWDTPRGRSAHSSSLWTRVRARNVPSRPSGYAFDCRRSTTFALPMSPGSSKITRVRCSDVSIRCTWTRTW